MKVIVKKDSIDIFPHLCEGSILENVRENGKNYIGVFTSIFGTYYIELPKKRCKKYREKKRLIHKLSKWLRFTKNS